MKKSKGKYDIILTIFLIIIFIALALTLGPAIFDEVKSEIAVKEALNDFEENSNLPENDSSESGDDFYDEEYNENQEDYLENDDEDLDADSNSTSKSNKKKNSSSGTGASSAGLSNYRAVGKIEIPKIKINYPIYDEMAKATLEYGVAIAYGNGVNQVGNTVIYGHNFRNGKFFSNIKKLAVGDIVYITDGAGNKVGYTVYNVYITDPNNADYMVRDTAGRREISLQTCTDDNSARVIVWATAD